MDHKITLYHGSEQIVEAPAFGLGSRTTTSGWAFTARKAKRSPRNGPYPLCATALPIVTALMRNT